MNKKIALVGAFDRNNYGDVLMPIVVEKALNDKNYQFDYYALKDVDLQNIGGKKCKVVEDIKKDNCDTVIFVGGEILSANYSGMFKNLQTNFMKLFIYRCMNKVFPKGFEKISKKILNGETSNPWVYSKKKLNCKKIIYNTVGGRNIAFDKEYTDIMKEVDYISVRDERTLEELKNSNINSILSPDSVIILSELFPQNMLKDYVDNKIVAEIDKLGQYFVFQVNKSVGGKKEKEIAEQINKVIKETGISCVLLPIGYAQGHEDYKPLKKILKRIDNVEKIYMPEDKKIFTTLYILANSSLYVGTSLHGAITAISYNIPHMAFSQKIGKLLDFIKSWNTTSIVYTDEKKLAEDVERLLDDDENKIKLSKNSKEIIEIVENNFKNIKRIIDGE